MKNSVKRPSDLHNKGHKNRLPGKVKKPACKGFHSGGK